MNEITKIHLARVSYDIDIDAKKDLEKYLVAIRKSLGDEVDAMEDIEIRMTEILAARGVTRGSVITENDIKAVRVQLGEPATFSSDDDSKKPHTKRPDSGRVSKKYYRDTDNEIFGGVIAGLAAYTGWDVTLLRILAVIVTVFPGWGFPIIIYFVLWIVAPAAETAGEKLEMRGEPVTIDTIKGQAKNVGERVTEVGKEVSEKVKKNFDTEKPVKPERKHRVNPILHGIMATFGIILLIGFIPALVVFAVTMAYIIMLLIPVDIVAKPLFVVGVSLALAFGFTLLASIVGLLVSMVRAKLDRGFWVNLAIMFVLLMGASICSGMWLSVAGADGIQRAGEVFRNELNIRTESADDGHVKVDIGPIEVDVH